MYFLRLYTADIVQLLSLLLYLMFACDWSVKWFIFPKDLVKVSWIHREHLYELPGQRYRSPPVNNTDDIVLVIDKEIMIPKVRMEDRKWASIV